MSAESMITVRICLLSGESIVLETPSHTTNSILYEMVFASLPDSIRPNTEWQLTLVQEKTGMPIVEEEVELSANEVIHLLIDPYEYELESESFDARDGKTNEAFLGYWLKVKTKSSVGPSYEEKVYCPARGLVEDGDDVWSSMRRCGKMDWEEVAKFPENKPFFTADEWSERYMTRMKEKMPLPVSSELFVRLTLENKMRRIKP